MLIKLWHDSTYLINKLPCQVAMAIWLLTLYISKLWHYLCCVIISQLWVLASLKVKLNKFTSSPTWRLVPQTLPFFHELYSKSSYSVFFLCLQLVCNWTYFHKKKFFSCHENRSYFHLVWFQTGRHYSYMVVNSSYRGYDSKGTVCFTKTGFNSNRMLSKNFKLPAVISYVWYFWNYRVFCLQSMMQYAFYNNSDLLGNILVV